MTTTIRLPRTLVRATVGLLACGGMVAGLSACGGGTASTSTGVPGAATTGAPGDSTITGPGGGGRNFDPAQLQKIRDCLTAAGIEVALPSGRPSFDGTRSFSPGSRPSFQRPSDFPSGTRPSGARGGFGALLNNPQAKAALDACGIVLPSFAPRNGQGQSPAAS